MLLKAYAILRNHEKAKSVTTNLVSRHLVNWFGSLGYGKIIQSCELLVASVAVTLRVAS